MFLSARNAIGPSFGFVWQGFGSGGGYRGGFCEKLQEAYPMFDKASASLRQTNRWPRPSQSEMVVAPL